ncbi:MAG: hypothetical protein ACI4FX_05735 [Agathobacter sp.]
MKNKNSKARMQVIFGVLLFTLVFMIELYGMLNYPDMFIILAVIAGVDLIFLFVVIDGLMELSDQKKARQEEQYDSVFKSEKASYLMLKKYFEEIEDKLNYLEQAAKVPTEEIVNAQKGIAKVIINRNHENMDALMNAYDQLLEEIEQFKDNLGETETIAKDYKDELLASQKSHELETEKALQIKIQDLTVALKDMELRLNNAMMQSQRVIAQAPMMTAPMPTYAPQPEAFKAEPEPEINSQAEPQTVEEGPEVEPKAESKPEPEAEPKSESEPEKSPVEEEKPPMPDLSDPNKTMSPDEIAALFANMGGGNEPAASEEPKAEPEAAEAEPKPEPEPEKSPVEEEKPPMPDLSDPNKTMSPDEIAALFANMGGGNEPAASEEPKAEPEAVEAEPKPEPEPEKSPVEEEKPPMPDLSDPNKTLSADEIAALFANMGA